MKKNKRLGSFFILFCIYNGFDYSQLLEENNDKLELFGKSRSIFFK